jgi:hypothetical protein
MILCFLYFKRIIEKMDYTLQESNRNLRERLLDFGEHEIAAEKHVRALLENNNDLRKFLDVFYESESQKHADDK